MASSAHDQPKIELVRLPANHDLPVSTAPQAAAAAEDQPALGYPPVIGYPQGDPRYLGPYAYPYPAPPPNIHGPYPAPDYDASYAQQQLESQMPPRMRNGILASITVSAFLLVTAVVVVQTVLWHRMPDLTLTGFSVSDLSVSIDSVMLANWDANITVENRNNHIRLEVTSLTSAVYYMDPDKYLSSTDIDGPLNLGTRSSRVASLKMSTSASEQPPMRVVEDVRDGLSNNRLVFGLEVNVVGKFKYSWWWKKSMAVTAYCEDLWVDFTGYFGSDSPATGSLAAANNPTKCLLHSYLS